MDEERQGSIVVEREACSAGEAEQQQHEETREEGARHKCGKSAAKQPLGSD